MVCFSELNLVIDLNYVIPITCLLLNTIKTKNSDIVSFDQPKTYIWLI